MQRRHQKIIEEGPVTKVHHIVAHVSMHMHYACRRGREWSAPDFFSKNECASMQARHTLHVHHTWTAPSKHSAGYPLTDHNSAMRML